MNWRREDGLARLAFGEASADEAARLEAEAARDPDAARILSEYRAMRAGFQALSQDVPADQLSKDRLRNAILEQGLRPKKRSNIGTWLWMPAATCALAAFLLWSRGDFLSRGEPQVRIPDSSLVLAGQSDARPFDRFIERRAETPRRGDLALSDKRPQAQVTVVSDSPKPSHKRNRRGRAPIDGIGYDPDVTVVGFPFLAPGTAVVQETPPETKVLDKPDTAAMSDAVALKQPSSTEGTSIVFIDQERDESTGAQRAVEVESSKNVVIGG